jgi:hypothetical protein
MEQDDKGRQDVNVYILEEKKPVNVYLVYPIELPQNLTKTLHIVK